MAFLTRTGLRINIYCSMADFQFSKWQLSAILNFQKLEILTPGPVRGHTVRHMPNFAKIRWTVPEIWPIFDFSRWRPPPSWILEISNFLTVATLKRVELRLHAKFCRNSSNRGWDMAISRFLMMAVVRYLGFSKVGNFNFRSHSEAKCTSSYQISHKTAA